MTAGPMPAGASGEASPPLSLARPVGAVADSMLMAQLDRATTWECWCVLTHRDGRAFAGRAGALRIFGTVMVRVDVPIGAATVTYGLHPDQVADWLVCSEADARGAAAVLGLPDRPVPIELLDGLSETVGRHGRA